MAARVSMENINVRIPPALIERTDALMPVASAAPELAMLVNVTRSDVLRLALLRGLAQLEAEYAGQPVLPGTEAAR